MAVAVAAQRRGMVFHIRSLLSGETLEDDLGVGVDLQVLDRLGVRAGLGAVCPLGELAQDGARGPQLSGKGLHLDMKSRPVWANKGRGGEERSGDVKEKV